MEYLKTPNFLKYHQPLKILGVDLLKSVDWHHLINYRTEKTKDIRYYNGKEIGTPSTFKGYLIDVLCVSSKHFKLEHVELCCS